MFWLPRRRRMWLFSYGGFTLRQRVIGPFPILLLERLPFALHDVQRKGLIRVVMGFTWDFRMRG